MTLWQRAAKLAAHFHRHQVRKGGSGPYNAPSYHAAPYDPVPYIVHPFRVALTLSTLFHVDDPVLLATGLLHDVLEDTTGDFDDIETACGTETARLVAALTKDSRLPEPERDEAYKKQLLAADWRVRLVKLADIYDNVYDARESGFQGRVHHWACWALDSFPEEAALREARACLAAILGEE